MSINELVSNNNSQFKNQERVTQSDFTAEKYAAKEFLDNELDDPRLVITRARISEARQFDRLFQPGNNPQPMKKGVEYSIV